MNAEVTEGTDAQFRFIRLGNTSVATRVGLYVGGLPKIMTDATEATVLTSEDRTVHIYGAFVDYILEFAAGETEKTLSFTTEADNVNEGDGWLGVRIVPRLANPFSIRTGYAQVHVHDDDIPTVSFSLLTAPTGTTTLEGDTWVVDIVEGNSISWVMSCSGNYEYSSPRGRGSLRGVSVLMQQLRLANPRAFYGDDNQHIMGKNLLGYRAGGNCDGLARVSPPIGRYIGPDGGLETFELIPRVKEPPIVATYLEAYRVAKAEADMAGTRVTKRDIIHPSSVRQPSSTIFCSSIPDELQYCPQYQVGTPHKIRLNLINRDPVILIKAESDQVVEGNPARFVLERLWNKELYGKYAQYPNTVVLLRASQDGQYINGALPTQITLAGMRPALSSS